MRTQLPLLLLLIASVAFPSFAQAKTSRKVSHDYERVWPTAVRFLRIDEGHKIIEKDFSTGYVLFEIAEEGKVFAGSLEVVRRQDMSNRDAVQLIVRIKERPSYMEHAILDRLLLKIRKELGLPKDPPEQPTPKEPAPSDKEQNKDKEEQAPTGEESPAN